MASTHTEFSSFTPLPRRTPTSPGLPTGLTLKLEENPTPRFLPFLLLLPSTSRLFPILSCLLWMMPRVVPSMFLTPCLLNMLSLLLRPCCLLSCKLVILLASPFKARRRAEKSAKCFSHTPISPELLRKLRPVLAPQPNKSRVLPARPGLFLKFRTTCGLNTVSEKGSPLTNLSLTRRAWRSTSRVLLTFCHAPTPKEAVLLFKGHHSRFGGCRMRPILV
mmetsp:Transcript_9612/g.26345  ORF Transcript_9612/g.26345 Transcript_9612/m.26345 type:complete len:220 (+) Transcript_9612:37-696(+)